MSLVRDLKLRIHQALWQIQVRSDRFKTMIAGLESLVSTSVQSVIEKVHDVARTGSREAFVIWVNDQLWWAWNQFVKIINAGNL